MGNATKAQISDSESIVKQLSDQLRTVFISTLLAFWVIAQNISKSVTITRGPWLPWAIASVLIFAYTVCRRKHIRWPKLRWVIPFLAVAILGLMYYISGLTLQGVMLIIFGILTGILVLWILHLSVTLISIMARVSLQGRFGRYTKCFVEYGENASRPLTLLVLVAGIVFGITRLSDVGVKGWQMTALVCFGLFIFLLVGVAYIFSIHRSSSR